jgi:hypothetical protein
MPLPHVAMESYFWRYTKAPSPHMTMKKIFQRVLILGAI